MHIIYVTRELPPSQRCGGIGSYVWDISRQIVNYGHEATVICASDDTRLESDNVIEGVRVIRLSRGDFAIQGIELAGNNLLSRYLRTITRYWSYRKKVVNVLDKIIDNGRVDLVEFPEYGNEAAVWMRRDRRIPLIVRLHTPTALDRKTVKRIKSYPFNWIRYHQALLEYELIKSANAVTSCSKSLSNWIKEDMDMGNLNIQVIYNPIDYHSWNKEKHESYVSHKREYEVLYVGTIVPAKGINELVDAIDILRRNRQDIRLTLVGKWGLSGKKLYETSLTNDTKAWLTVLQQVPREDLSNYFKKSSIVCFPAWWENFPMVCLEAMASGAIILASSSGGMSEIIEDEVDGFLVEPKDPVKLADKIEYILSLPEDKKLQIRIKAQEKIKHTFDMKVVLPKMLQFYEKVISEFKRS